MLKIIINIPLFVWPLLTILLISGLKARKPSRLPLKVLFLFPLVFFGWSLFSFFGKYADDALAVALWLLCVGVGSGIGFYHTHRMQLGFDRQNKIVEMPGSWLPLMLSMSIFSAKLSIGMLTAMQPQLKGSVLFLVLELIATIVLGVFAGRAANCLMRYRASCIRNGV